MQFIRPDINIDFIGKRKFAFIFSLVLIVVSIGTLIEHGGPRYGIDFAGGTLIQVRFDKPVAIAQIKDGLRSEFSKRTLQEVVSGDRAQIMDILSSTAKAEAKQIGIDVLDVRIKRIDLPAEVSSSVYRRMRAERERVARDFRSRGAEAAERIRADADRKSTVILAEAYRDAERQRGEGDARAAEIYAQAFNKNPEFYSFYRSLNAYRSSFQGDGDILVMQSDSEFFQYSNSQQFRRPAE